MHLAPELVRRVQNIRAHGTLAKVTFDAAKYGGVADEPWIELTIPSVADPALAPAGRHLKAVKR